ncbi:MAG: T9SS type A sorting domain-containing protein [bacterium]|nr:T9SS type A sorting domain-containing protein [bacterium]
MRLNLPIGTRNVKLTVTNVLGQTVEQREIEVLAPRVDIQLSLDNHPSGIYFAQAQALNKTQITKLVLLK